MRRAGASPSALACPAEPDRRGCGGPPSARGATVSISNRLAHPLDPLAPEEIEAAAAIVRERCEPGAALRFVSIDLCEPPKAGVLSGADDLPRKARVVLHLRDERAVVQAVVSLTDAAVESWRRREDAQSPPTVR